MDEIRSPSPTGAVSHAQGSPNGSGATVSHPHRLEVLDGVRAVSILLVLACHLFPVGPKSWLLNTCAGLMGMALFFTLSGFLITTTLLRHPSVPSFLIRRFARIVPLAWLATLIYLSVQQKSGTFFTNTLFYTINYQHPYLTPLTSPFWSLCVEVHFYLAAALVTLAFGARGLPLLSIMGLLVTANRAWIGCKYSIITHLRVDEILAGVSLALIWSDRLGRFGRWVSRAIGRVPVVLLAVAFVAGSHPLGGPLLYLRPYLAAALVGRLLFAPSWLGVPLSSRPMRYIAEISYALYVIHPITRFGWLASGGTSMKYLLKCPIGLAITFGLAHLSTFYFERPCIAIGKRLSRRWERSAPAPRLINPPTAITEVAV